MKKLGVILIMILAATGFGYAQVVFIPRAGATVSFVAFSDDIINFTEAEFGPKAGFIVGIGVEIPISHKFALQPELLWHQKGYYYYYEEIQYWEEYNYTLNYLEVPLLAKVKFGRFFVVAGPYFGYGISGTYKGEYNELGQGIDEKGKVKFGKQPENYEGDNEYVDNAADFGVQTGLGIKIKSIVIDLRYGIGLSDLYDTREGFTGDTKSQNRSLQLTLGVPLGEKN
jgi:hypothetical protein